MRAGAFRRGLGPLLLIAVVFLGLAGCSTPVKQDYLRHLEVTIAPAQAGGELARP